MVVSIVKAIEWVILRFEDRAARFSVISASQTN
jgi:hypothetical protein